MKDRLQQLRELLTPSENWTKNAFARDRDGNPTGTALHFDATCFCLLGGIDKVCPEGPHIRRPMRSAIMDAIRQRYQDHRFVMIFDFNDDEATTHEMVLDVIDRAVAHA